MVKAYPQPSKQYGETVCCAAISEDGSELLRLYPIRYRALSPENRFTRFDLLDVDLFKSTDDPRPESHKVVEDSIKVVKDRKLTEPARTRLWLPFVSESLEALSTAQKNTCQSLGIIKPDTGSVKFKVQPIADATEEAREATQAAFEQQSLFEDSLSPLPQPEYVFSYVFRSDGKRHQMQLHDWEVQAAWINYRRKYGEEAMDRLCNEYDKNIPSNNLHFIMGTIKNRPWQFMIIGLLRTSEDIEQLQAQQELF